SSFAQTSWKGTVNTYWNTSGNWTSGVPTTSTNAIIGDANFTGSYQPTVNVAASCNSITIGGAHSSNLTLTKSLVVNSNFTINSNGTITHPNSSLTVKGDWTNYGTYTTTNNNSKVIFGGLAQHINGSVVTNFRDLVINAGATVLLGINTNITGAGSSVQIKGALDPGQLPTYTLTSTVNFRVFNNGSINVNAATFAANYNLSGIVTLSSGSTVEYSSTSIDQTISSAYTYSNLNISGTGTKTLIANLPDLYSLASKQGNIAVNSGILDLGAYTANRGTSTNGGSFSVMNGAFLKVGGLLNFPNNYKTTTLTLGSTVEYNGINQTVSAQSYGNLIFSSKSGASVKTMPGTDFTIEGDFSSVIGLGSSVSYTGASNITFNGNVSIGASTTFNSGNYFHNIQGNWVNTGTFSGNSGTIFFGGPSSIISGSGNQNFNNISFTASGIIAAAGTTLNIGGNFSTSGSGQFTQMSGGVTIMSGTSKSISGSNIYFNDLTASGTISTASSFTIVGNLSVTGTFSASSGTINLNGTSKTISGVGTIGFNSLQTSGSITTNTSFSISNLLDVTGTFSASAGTVSFTGSSVLSGTANLFNATINGTSLQLSASAVLGIANVFTISSGTLNVTASLPNTINFNGTGAQNVNAITYNNLILSNGNTKTAAGNITVNGNITISSATNFDGMSYTHSILRNWINNGTFTPSASIVQFTGTNNSTITGVTTFNELTLNKSASTNTVTLLNNVTSAIVNMTTGKMLTGLNKITITTTRSGNGIILGTITRTHAFTTGISYAFEGSDNTINFSSATGITSITVSITLGSIDDFPDNASINRLYNISVTGTSYTATLRLHYEDAELNGNDESVMGLWNYNSSWNSMGKSGANTINNYVEQSGLTDISTRWTCSELPGVVRWNGSLNSNWQTAGNWTNVSGTASTPPGATDIVQIGTSSFTNQPTISTAVDIKAITFGSVQAATLTLGAGGSLTTSGNIGGSWTANTVHTIDAGNQNLTVNGDLTLSNGVSGRSINLNIGTGTVSVLGTCLQKGDAAIVFTGAGLLNLGNDFDYTSGAFTAGTGTVTYNGTDQQDVANVTYNNFTVNNTSGNAMIPDGSNLYINGNLSILSGQLEVDNSTINIAGNTSIASGSTLNCSGVIINAAGDWNNLGTYLSTTGTVFINGSGAQNISSGNFNNLTIDKSSGVATLTGINIIAGDLKILQGSLDLSTYTLNRQSSGGNITMASATTLMVGGANNFPSMYSVNSLDAGSTVLYNGTIAQSVAGVSYGNLSFSNGNTNAKTQLSDLTVKGNLLINGGASFNSGGYILGLSGNWINNGTFIPTSGTVLMNGTGKLVSGNTTFNKVTVNGSYNTMGYDLAFNGLFWVTTGGSFISPSATATATFNGDLTNNGTLIGNGITTFGGTSMQTIRLVNALVSASTGVVNFNGNVSPVLNSNTSPQFATLNVNNTAGIHSSVGGKIFVALNVNTGASLTVDNATYTIYGSLTNLGTVAGTGTIDFSPPTPKTIALGTSGFSNDGTVIFGGSGQITMTGKPDYFNTVIISNSNSAGVSPSSNWNVDSNFVVTVNSIFNAGSYTYTVGGDIISDGSLNGNASTFITTDVAAEISASAETYFNHLTNNGTLTPQTDFNVLGNFTNNGTYDGSVGTLIMSGNSAATIGGTTSPSPIAQLTIQKTNNATVSQSVNLSGLSFLNIVSGTLFTSTKTITQDPGGGILVINDSATLKLGGTNSLPGFSGYGLDVNSFVDYAGITSTQAVGNAANYGNLIISGTGSKNAYTALTVLGNLSISNGIFNTSTITIIHSIAGNFTMTGGSITGTNANYTLNGTQDQNLNLISPLVKLTVNKALGKVILGSDVTVSQLLTFTKGNIRTGNYKVIIPSLGSVSGALQSTGWINGNLQKSIASGTPVSQSFEIGDSAYYSPASILFANVGTAGNIIAKVIPTDHPQSGYSLIDTTKSVNRYWSINNAGVGFTNADVTLNWTPTDIDAGANYLNFKASSFNGTTWLLNSIASPLATSIKATGCTLFGDFIVGESLSQFKWTGNALTSDWYTRENWIGGVPTNAINTLIPSGLSGGKVYPIINKSSAIVKDLTIENNASLIVDSATLKVSGAINNSGVLDLKKGSLEMNGVSAQILAANAFKDNALKNFVINNTSVTGVSLGGALDIYGGLTFSGTGKTLNTNDTLTLKSDSAGTAWVGNMTGNSILGKVTVERFITSHKAWRLLSIPTNTNQTIKQAWQESSIGGSSDPVPGFGTQITSPSASWAADGFDLKSASPSMKTYDAISDSWVGVPTTNATNIKNNNGYLVYVRGDRLATGTASPETKATLRTKGSLYTGTLPPLTAIPDTYMSVGNPYASPIDFTKLTIGNGIDNKFYAFDPFIHGYYGYGGFQVISAAYGWKPMPGGSPVYPTDSVNTTIQSGEAFFVHATTVPSFLPANYTITFSENAKVGGGDTLISFARPQ
ncbi:MAG: hypothetical protein ABI091_16620, partial [Ferruginibacter sp.]